MQCSSLADSSLCYSGETAGLGLTRVMSQLTACLKQAPVANKYPWRSPTHQYLKFSNVLISGLKICNLKMSHFQSNS